MKFYASKTSSAYFLILNKKLGFIFNYNLKEEVVSFFDTKDYGTNVEITKEEFIEACKPLLEKTGLIKLLEDSDSKDVLGKTQWQRTAEELYKENESLKQKIEGYKKMQENFRNEIYDLEKKNQYFEQKTLLLEELLALEKKHK